MAGRFPATWPINYSAGEVFGQLASEPVSVKGKGETGEKEWKGSAAEVWGLHVLLHMLIC